MFKSASIGGHLARGVLGFGSLAIALLYSSQLGAWILLPALAALFFLRGCPTCWTAGLVEAIWDRRKARQFCPDGSCAGDKTHPDGGSSSDPGGGSHL